jgi:hypothetical protein
VQYTKNNLLCGFLVSLITSLPALCIALDFEARQWSHLPNNISIIGGGYAHTESDIDFNPILSIEDAELELETWVVKYVRTFDLFDKSARIELTQAYQQGNWTGLLNGVQASVYRSGLSDTFVRFAVNLYGAPPLASNQYYEYRSCKDTETIVGLGLVARLPTGEYMNDKLINLGENRFTFRPQLGLTRRSGKWAAELVGEAALHADNDDFFNGKKREQDPTYILHAHLTHTFRPGVWVSTGIGYDFVGENSIDNIDSDDEQQNLGWLIRFAYPINQQSGFSFTYLGTRKQKSIGNDSDTLAAGLSFSW